MTDLTIADVLKKDYSIVRNKIPQPNKAMYELRPILSIDEVFEKLGSRPQGSGTFMDEIEKFGHVGEFNWFYLAYNPYPNSPEQWFGEYFFYPKCPEDHMTMFFRSMNEIKNGLLRSDDRGPVQNQSIHFPKAVWTNVPIEFCLPVMDQRIKEYVPQTEEEVDFFIGLAEHGKYSDQLAAIEILSNSQSQKACDFLNGLTEYEVYFIRREQIFPDTYINNERLDKWVSELKEDEYGPCFEILFKNAHGPLRGRLDCYNIYPRLTFKYNKRTDLTLMSKEFDHVHHFVFYAAIKIRKNLGEKIDKDQELRRFWYFED